MSEWNFNRLNKQKCSPCLFQQKEQQIQRQFHDTVKIQQKQYKALKEQILQNTPKHEQKAIIKKLKEEQMRKVAMLGEQYQGSISEMMQQQNVTYYRPLTRKS